VGKNVVENGVREGGFFLKQKTSFTLIDGDFWAITLERKEEREGKRYGKPKVRTF